MTQPNAYAEQTKPKRHKHVFTALWWGDDHHHMHQCFTKGCDVILYAEGKDCMKEGQIHEVRK